MAQTSKERAWGSGTRLQNWDFLLAATKRHFLAGRWGSLVEEKLGHLILNKGPEANMI